MDSGFLRGSGSTNMKTEATIQEIREYMREKGISQYTPYRKVFNIMKKELVLEEMERVKATESYSLRIEGLTRIIEYLVSQLPE